jgi:hypothetical protein
MTGRPLIRLTPSAVRSTVKYADDEPADAANCRIADSTCTDMTHVARERYRSGSAFQTLNTSMPPKEPSVVVTTSTFVFASSAVKMPRGLDEPEPVMVWAASRSV